MKDLPKFDPNEIVILHPLPAYEDLWQQGHRPGATAFSATSSRPVAQPDASIADVRRLLSISVETWRKYNPDAASGATGFAADQVASGFDDHVRRVLGISKATWEKHNPGSAAS